METLYIRERSPRRPAAAARLRVLFLAALLVLVVRQPAPAQTIDQFYDDSVLQEVRLTMSPADWATLQANYTKSTRYPATFQWGDVVVTNVGLRVRGSGSRNPVKPGLGIEFDRFVTGQTFLGTSEAYLKNLAEEESMMNERLSMKLIRRMGLPAPRGAHARVYVNGQYLGLFLLTESIDQQYVQRNLGESSGTIYSYNYIDPYRFEYLGDDPVHYTPEPFEASPEKDPHPELLAEMIRTINEASDAEFPQAIAKYFDPALMMAHVAADNFLTEDDGIVSSRGMANFYLYRRDQPSLFQFLHWDKDYTLIEGTDQSVTWNLDSNVLTRRAMQVPEFRDAYLDAMTDIALAAGGADGWLHQEAQRVYDQIHQAALDDTNKQCGQQSCSNEQFEAGARGVLDFTANRGANVLAQVAALRDPADTTRITLAPGAVTSVAGGQTVLAPGLLATLAMGDSGSADSSTTVSVNGLAAPVLATDEGKVTFQVPWEAVPGSAYVQARVGGRPSTMLFAPMTATAPGVLGVTHADGSPVSSGSPAVPGETIVVYATGLGPVTPQPATGEEPGTVSSLRYTPTIYFGSTPVKAVFSGLLPNYIGLYQLNIQVPDQAPGAGALQLEVNGQRSAAVLLLK